MPPRARALGLGRPAPGVSGELAHDHRGDEIDGERDPVLPVGERERVERWKEEEVEGEHAADGHRDRVSEPQSTATGSTANT